MYSATLRANARGFTEMENIVSSMRKLQKMTKQEGQFNVYLSPAPADLEEEFQTLLTPEAIEFLVNLVLHFQDKVNDLYTARIERKFTQRKTGRIPKFMETNFTHENWKVSPVNHRLQNRHLDLGDVSPSDHLRFTSCLRANVQGVQVDFDDGHCPTWTNQIMGLYNVYRAVHNDIANVPKISNAPILMLRPRAWNMMEHNMSINGREVPGPLFDFGLLMFHNGLILSECDSGPFFYLSKLEGAREAKLWNEIFTWSQLKLRIPYGTIKASVLIENILSAFEMDQILYELRDHSLGLNCGIWDYAASIISKFGDDSSFLLPDRNKYVNMGRPFLSKYMDLVVQTCHRRNAHATGGMTAQLLPANKQSKAYYETVEIVLKDKLSEIKAGVDGFMIYDLGLVEFINDLWSKYGGPCSNQVQYKGNTDEKIMEKDLLTLPKGGVTEEGLKHNITVAILFIYNWLCGRGVFQLKGAIEDSATAEISRAQIWQWIRHGALMENKNNRVTRSLVFCEASKIYKHLINGSDNSTKTKLAIAFNIFLEIVNHRDFPEFITTYLNDAHIFRASQAHL